MGTCPHGRTIRPCRVYMYVLRWAISVNTQVVLYICCHVTMVILMAWRGTVVAPVLMHFSCCRLALGHQCQYASCFIHMLSCYHGHIDGLAWNILEQPITIMSQHTENHLTPDMQISVIYLLYLLKPIVYCCTCHIVMHLCCYFSCQYSEQIWYTYNMW